MPVRARDAVAGEHHIRRQPVMRVVTVTVSP